MSKMKPEKSRIKSDILLRVRLLYILFILAGLLIFARLVWVQLFSSEVAYNAERLAGRIFTEQIIPAQRGNILTRDGDPLATSIFRYRVEFDFGSPGLDSVRTFHEQSDSLSKLLAAYFGDRSAAEYRRMFRTQHAKHYQVKYRKDTLVPRSEGRIARWIDRILDREFVPKKLYDTLRDHTPVQIFPRDIDYTEWETLRKYPLLNWNMGMVYNLRESDERIYPQGELGRRTIGLTGDRGNYGIEAVYREELAGRDGRATRQRIARGFYGRVVDGDNIDPIDGLDVVTTLDLDVQDVANRYLREQLEAQNAIWGTTIVMEVRTGEILALVNLGRTPGGGYAERENYAIGRNTEPGSTFKLASMLLLLDDADMPLDQTYDTGNGRVVKVGGIRVQDSHAGFNDMDFRTAPCVVEALRRRGIRTYVLSNNNPASMEFVRRMFTADGHDMEYYFDAVYLSYRMHELKPSEAIFRKMIAASGLEPAETLFIDDGSRNVDTAQALGFSIYMPAPQEDFGHLLESVGRS